MSKAELWLGVKYSEMNKQQKKIYWNMCKKESRKKHPESIKESNRKYQEKQKQKIADLEAKLAEKDKAIENWEAMYKSVMQTCHNDKEEIERLSNELKDMSYSSSYQEFLVLKEKLEVEQNTNKVLIEREKELKQQLANQENTITNLIEDNRASQEWYKKQLAEKQKELKAKETLNQIFKDNREAKISFAVEQLEFAQKYIQQYVNNFDDMNDCLSAIDNQIKQLKEMR